MLSNENKILLELEELGQELAKRKKKELEAKRVNLATTWTGGSVFSCFLFYFMFDDPWSMIYMFITCAVLGIPFIFWTYARLNNINQEIRKLERKRKELRNSVR